jgi:hypothetical protein
MYGSLNANGLKIFTSDCVVISKIQERKQIYIFNYIETCSIANSNGRLTWFLHSYKNDLCPTLQIEQSHLLVLSHNLRK